MCQTKIGPSKVPGYIHYNKYCGLKLKLSNFFRFSEPKPSSSSDIDWAAIVQTYVEQI